MPSTTPDFRMATARGFCASGSWRLGGNVSRAGADEGLASSETLDLGDFASAGHIASNFAGWSGRGGDPPGEVDAGDGFQLVAGS